jgi:hypothetical protein
MPHGTSAAARLEATPDVSRAAMFVINCRVLNLSYEESVFAERECSLPCSQQCANAAVKQPTDNHMFSSAATADTTGVCY